MSLISYLTSVHFENGALRKLGDVLGTAGISRPMVVTDRGVLAAGLIEKLTEVVGIIPDERCYRDTPPNPNESAVDMALEQYREGGCDGIVAIGGGSPIDLAKAVALKATHDGELSKYAAVHGGSDLITSAVAPVVAIPTTSGTGSEVGRATLIVMNDGYKRAIVSPFLLPKVAICDPLLTIGLPRSMTAGTGMDAIAHCVETLLSPRVNPPADAIALDGLARGAAWVEKACEDGGDTEARWQMMMCSLEGGLAFQKGLGAVHALSHALGTLTSPVLHHGTLNAILLPPVLQFNAPAVRDKFAKIRKTLALDSELDLSNWFTNLTRRLGLPTSLSEISVPASVLPRMARMALSDFSAQTNPRTAQENDFLLMLQSVH